MIQRVHAPKVNPCADKTQKVVYLTAKTNQYDNAGVTRENYYSLKSNLDYTSPYFPYKCKDVFKYSSTLV